MQRLLIPAARPAAALSLQALAKWSALPWLMAALLLLGLVLRGSLLDRPGLHPDEALYAGWALRIADGSDPALLGVAVDKPPFLPYALAGAFRLAGVRPGLGEPDFERLELAGRLLGVAASVAALAALALIARQVYGWPAALAAVALAAASPLAVRLSPTLFTDPWLVLWLLVAAWAALRGYGWRTGLAAGLAYAAKQQAVLFLPWLAALFLLVGLRQDDPSGGRRRSLWGLLWGFLLPVALVTWWDSLRWQWRPSFWDRSLTTYGGVAPIAPADLPRQAAAWAELLGFLFGSPPFALLLLATLPLTAWAAWRERRTQRGRFDLLLLAQVAAYLALHLGTTLAPWDRYALPLAPLVALLLASGLQRGAQWARAAGPAAARPAGWLAAALVAAATLHASALAVGDRLPVGDSRGYDGAAAAAAYVRRSHPDAVLYHHWLGWHYSFYLHGSTVELRWWETPADLAAKAASEAGGRPQFVAVPAGRDAGPLLAALADAHVTAQPALTVRRGDGSLSLVLYRLQPGVAVPGALPGRGQP